MPGPAPKPAALRQRQNKKATRAFLPSAESMSDAAVPELPPGPADGWHPMVEEWWADVWRSPMASEYLKADVHGLFRLAQLQQDFWTAESISGRLAVASEIRLASVPFGLSPIDRARLQWEVEKGEAAGERVQRRRTPRADESKDPRELLKAVS